MVNLVSTRIFRGGASTRRLIFETQQVSCEANNHAKSLDVRFRMASKGGGTTAVLIEMTAADLESALREIAYKMPETEALFLDCLGIAHKRNMELLASAQSASEAHELRADVAVQKLETIENFVSNKHFEALFTEAEQVGLDYTPPDKSALMGELLQSIREIKEGEGEIESASLPIRNDT